MNPARSISACLITKDPIYPEQILQHVNATGFGEILILTNCDSPHRKHELFEKAKYDALYYQDDDCIAPIEELLTYASSECNQGKIVCAMKTAHLRMYLHSRIALIGWGSIFPKGALSVLGLYRDVHGEDALYKRETERILTYFHYPQVRLALPIVDLPSATEPDRLSMQPGHYENIKTVEDRCARILLDRANQRPALRAI